MHFSQVKYLEQYHLEYKAFPFLQVCLKHLTWGTTRTDILLLVTLNSLTDLTFNTQAQILGLLTTSYIKNSVKRVGNFNRITFSTIGHC